MARAVESFREIEARLLACKSEEMITGNWYRVWRGSRMHYFLAPEFTKTACGKSFNMITSMRNTGIPLCSKCKQWVDENPMVIKASNEEKAKADARKAEIERKNHG
jgi:hypothetical protein